MLGKIWMKSHSLPSKTKSPKMPTKSNSIRDPLRACKMTMTPFFRRYINFAPLSGRGLQNIIGHMMIILKLRDVQVAQLFCKIIGKTIFKST